MLRPVQGLDIPLHAKAHRAADVSKVRRPDTPQAIVFDVHAIAAQGENYVVLAMDSSPCPR